MWNVVLVFLGFADLLARVLLCSGDPERSAGRAVVDWIVVFGGASAAAALLAGGADGTLPVLVGCALVAALAGRHALRFVHVRGQLCLMAAAAFRVGAVGWLIHLDASAAVPLVDRVLLAVLAAAAVAVMPVHLLDNFLLQEAACRSDWQPRDPVPHRHGYRPAVTVHVPCHAEPPGMVNATLDALSRLDYPDFDVIVIDNNTTDELLWRPVREHCARLGRRFTFLHVEGLTGAKAGALNYALERTRPGSELIAVVDADYQAEPGFLRDLVGLFAEKQLGFVQTSHDYRDWSSNRYLAGCYWEYRGMYGGYMRSRSERGTALTTGTMCVIRRRALEEVGGWATWCCTEDSELSIRLHARGFAGRYVHRTYGRGLVPEEFAQYRQQRYRWIFGPTQEFRRHWRLYLPGRLAVPSALSRKQKLLLAHHGARELAMAAASLVATATAVALALSPLLGAGSVPVSVPAAVGLAAGGLSAALVLWPLFRQAVGCSRVEALRAIACRAALFGTRLSAGLAGWRSAAGTFKRTSKFPASPRWSRAVASTAGETLRGVAALVVATVAASRESPAALLLAGYLALRALGWLAAPVLALSANRRLNAR